MEDRLSEESQWFELKNDVVRDFMEYIQTEESLRRSLTGNIIDPVKPDPDAERQDPVYYLYKRVFMENPHNFYIFAMQKMQYKTRIWPFTIPISKRI